MMRLMRLVRVVVMLVPAMGWIAPARAHDFGAMKVTGVFSAEGEFAVDVVVDLELLPSGVTAPARWTSEAIAAFREQFADNVVLCFDGRRAAVKVVDSPGQASAVSEGVAGSPTLAFRLVGQMPAGARVVTWSHEWAVGEYFVRLARAEHASASRGAQDDVPDESVVHWLKGGEVTPAFELAGPSVKMSRLDVVGQYLALGFTHIVPKGLDHILFVLGLFLLSFKARPLLAQITAFTVAHSITLGLSMLGVVSLPGSVVEPLIALSIAYVAVENVCVTGFKPWRTAIVFGFGLLHGLGFAGVLRELGLPRGEFFPALVSFNVGVELGQLAVVGAAFAAVGVWFGARPWYRARVVIPASLAIALVGVYWTVERVAM